MVTIPRRHIKPYEEKITCHLQTVVCKCCFSYMNNIDCIFLAKYPILSQGEHQTTLIGGWEGKDLKKRIVFLL